MSFRFLQQSMQPLCRLASAGTRLSPAAYSQRLSSVARVETRSELSEEIAKDIVRHGKGDGVVTLNVGGKEFKTLRSTLHVNPVLRDRVLKAEGNNELADGAIFIDRDPAQFGLILAHLRNVADSISMMSSRKKAAVHRLFSNEVKNEVNIQIPKDHAKMRDLFVEARYFKIKELQDVLCSYDIFTWVASMLGGQGSANPFHVAAQSLQFARRALLTTGGVGILVGSQNDSLVDNIQNSIGNFLRIITGASPKAE